MRFFCISYTANSYTGFAHGHISFAYLGFPSFKVIREKVSEMSSDIKVDTLAILSIYEFKNEADFQNFIS